MKDLVTFIKNWWIFKKTKWSDPRVAHLKKMAHFHIIIVFYYIDKLVEQGVLKGDLSNTKLGSDLCESIIKKGWKVPIMDIFAITKQIPTTSYTESYTIGLFVYNMQKHGVDHAKELHLKTIDTVKEE